MKIEKNTRYFTIAAYTIISSLIIVIGICLIINFKALWHTIIYVLSFIFNIFKPLIFGLILAYLLEPVVVFYEKRWHGFSFHTKYMKKKRWHLRTMPTFLAFITLLAIIGLFVLLMIMNLRSFMGMADLLTIKESIRRYIFYFYDMTEQVTSFTSQLGLGNNSLLASLYGFLNNLSQKFTQLTIEFVSGVGSGSLNWALGLVIAFYLLQDKERSMAASRQFCKFCFPVKVQGTIEIIRQDLNHVFSGYIRGQLIDAVIVAILTSVILTIIQLDFAVIIGIIAGIFNLIPYFGPIVGFVLALLIGVLDPNPIKAVYAGVSILILQQIDGWIIVPKVVGEYVKLHPVTVLLAIVIGGNLFGLIGMLIGVPVAAFLRLIILRYMPMIFPEGESVREEAFQKEQEEAE